jgi:ribosomal 50S subunit-associated protein YjgA (DUF615 family)
MYKILNPIPKFIISAEKKAKEEFLRLGIYFELCEEYVEHKKIVLGGICGLRLNIGMPLDLDSFMYEFYTREPFEHAKKLVNILFEKTGNKYLFLQTNIANNEYTISSGTDRLIKFYADNNSDIELFDFSEPGIQKGYFTEHKIFTLNPFLQLIKVYQILYSPNFCSEWGKYLEYESELSQIIKKKSFGDASISGSSPVPIGTKSVKETFLQKESIKDDITEKITKAFRGKAVFLENVTKDRVQFISQDDIDDDFEIIRKILAEYKCKYTKQNPRIQEDFRLTRNTIYATINNSAVPIIDVFNSGQYEIIPHEKYKATYFVSLRFLLVDVWTLIFIKNIGKINEFYANKQIQEKMRKIKKIYEKIEKLNKIDLFPLPIGDNYFGIFVDERIERKKMEKQHRFIPSYYPYIR